MNTHDSLHQRYNRRSDQIAPVRVKGLDRKGLAQLFAELGFTHGAEVGVADGLNSLTLCENIPNLRLVCVDPWAMYPENPFAHSTESQEMCYRKVQERLAPYPATFLRAMSLDAAATITDGSLDFVYLDGNHVFDFIMQDLIVWSRKVRAGGIVAGHDYYRFRNAGVVDAVDAYTKAHQIHEWFIDDQREPSWFFAKP